MLYNNISIISRDPDRMKNILPAAICAIASDPRTFIDEMKKKTVDLFLEQLR